MVSPALIQLLERTRARFGVEVQVLDTRFKSLYPSETTELSRKIQESASVRNALMEALSTGRAHRLETSGSHYRIYPLDRSTGRDTGGILAIRSLGSGSTESVDPERWSDLARAMVEADLSVMDSLAGERQRSRRLTGTLRFLQHLIDAPNETAVAQALVHAAAVWYDVDARVYYRNRCGDFVLHSWLPGAHPEERSRLFRTDIVGSSATPVRLDAASELGDLSDGHEFVLVPLVAASRADWVLVLVGSVAAEADLVLRLIAQVAGARLGSFLVRRLNEARLQFQASFQESAKAPELVAMRFLQSLAHTVDAESASLTLARQGEARRIAAIGPFVGMRSEPNPHSTHDCVVRTIPFAGENSVTIELCSAARGSLTADAHEVADAGAVVLGTWLAGSMAVFDAPSPLSHAVAADTPGFSTRIQEELERAQRFDLRLSLILIECAAPSDGLAALQDAVRSELRGSDVTGKMNGRQVAALLTHTDALGLDNVVRRLKLRLAATASRLNVPALRLGQAAFSPEVRTAQALLDLALRQAEPVIVH